MSFLTFVSFVTFLSTAEPAIAFGARHAIALRSNGDVVTWGYGVGCQLGRGSKGNQDPAPGIVLRHGKQIAAASDHNLVLTTDGKVYGWGTNAEGQLGLGHEFDACEGPTLVESLVDKTVTHIATGNGFSIAVTSTGDLYCSGDNGMGQCPVGKTGSVAVFTRVPLPELAGKVSSVKAGAFHSLLLTTDGTLYALGRGRDGQLGNGRTVNGLAHLPEMTGVVSIAAGIWHSVALRSDGSVWVWGNNSRSQLCDGTTTNRATPAKVEPLSGQAPVTQISAGGHSTAMRTSDGGLYVCGDNQSGLLGVDGMIVPKLTKVPVAPIKSGMIAFGGNNAAYSPDGCAIRIAGYNEGGVVGGDSASSRIFVDRPATSLCAAASATPLPNLVRVPPSGGESGCLTSRKEEDAVASPKWSPLREAMLAAEGLLRKNAAYMTAPEPVRIRTSIAAGPGDESGARMHIQAVAERKFDGTRVWAGASGCEVIPQVDRIGGSIAHVSVFFNIDPRGQFIGPNGQAPKLTGRVGAFPEYDGWVVITKDGRLPWIPLTLADKLDAEGARRERALADWLKQSTSMKLLDEAAVAKSVELLRKTDPAGADNVIASARQTNEEIRRQQREVVPVRTAALEKQLNDYKKYRASFSADELRAPAVWGDPTGAAKRQLDARIAELQRLTPAAQTQLDQWTRESRGADRETQAALTAKIRALRQQHMEQASPLMDDARAQYELTNLKPGTVDKAMGVKEDPSFPDRTTPARVQLITVRFAFDADPRNTARVAWGQRVRDTFDFAALVALIR